MSDWAQSVIEPGSMIYSTIGKRESIAGDVDACLSDGSFSQAWPAANRAIYCAVIIPVPVTVYKMAWKNGPTINGNVDVGIYNLDLTPIVRLGGAAQSGASTSQIADIADTALNPGTYYFAMASDSATATFFQFSLSSVISVVCGVQQQATAYPLPSPAVFANPATGRQPVVIAACRVTL